MTDGKQAKPARIDNTTRRMQEDPAERMALLAEGMITGDATSFIEGQERAGQHQIVNSDRLPADHGDDSPWLELGFTFGDPDPADPLFCPATLPPGWKREGSDHAMWSHLTDEHGRQRAGVFYKAAFYDRKASMHLVGVSWYVCRHVEYGGPWSSPMSGPPARRCWRRCGSTGRRTCGRPPSSRATRATRRAASATGPTARRPQSARRR